MELLKGYPVIITLPVLWGDMDALQHVNNTVYFRYFESVRIAYFEKMELWDYMKSTGIGPILASTQCRFKIPLTYPDTVSVGAKVSSIEADRFNMDYLVISHNHQRAAAEGSGVIVTYNYKEGKKIAVPDQIRTHIERVESGK